MINALRHRFRRKMSEWTNRKRRSHFWFVGLRWRKLTLHQKTEFYSPPVKWKSLRYRLLFPDNADNNQLSAVGDPTLYLLAARANENNGHVSARQPGGHWPDIHADWPHHTPTSLPRQATAQHVVGTVYHVTEENRKQKSVKTPSWLVFHRKPRASIIFCAPSEQSISTGINSHVTTWIPKEQ